MHIAGCEGDLVPAERPAQRWNQFNQERKFLTDVEMFDDKNRAKTCDSTCSSRNPATLRTKTKSLTGARSRIPRTGGLSKQSIHSCKTVAIACCLLATLLWPATANMHVDTEGAAITGTKGLRMHGSQKNPALPQRKKLQRSASLGTAAFDSAEAGHAIARDAVMLLDLDKTTIFGNDGNDIGLALQWMNRPKDVLDKLYRTLVSPLLRPAFEQFKWVTHKLDVVIYTRRPALLTYRSCFRRCMIPLRYHRMQKDDGQLYIPGEIASPAEMFKHFYCGPKLLAEELNDVTKSLQRLFAARDALTAALGLTVPPTVVVTAGVKNVESTVGKLGLGSSRAFLFDDNRALRHDGHVVRVDPLVSLPAEQRHQLLNFLEKEQPIASLEIDLVDFLLGAPETERAIEWDQAGKCWAWRVPLAKQPLRSWPVPKLLDAPRNEGEERASSKASEHSTRRTLRFRRQLSCL